MARASVVPFHKEFPMKSALVRSSLSLVAVVTLAFVGCDDAAKTKTSTPPPAATTPVVTPPKDDAAKTPATPISNAATDSARKPAGK
jgi:hypothetical protein